MRGSVKKWLKWGGVINSEVRWWREFYILNYVKDWNQNDGRSVNGRGQNEGQPMRGCQRVES